VKRYWIFLLLFSAVSARADIGEIDVNAGPPAEPAASVPQDKSALWLKSGTRVTLLVTDKQGRRAGVDPKTYGVLKDIPSSSCDVDFIQNQYTGDEHSEASERVTFDPAAKGVYTLLVHGLQSGPFEVSVSALSKDGSSEPTKEVEGIISEGENKIFKLSYDPAPNASLSVVDRSK